MRGLKSSTRVRPMGYVSIGNRLKPTSSNRQRRRISSLLAMLAIVLNFLVPVTHGFLMSAEAGEFVEICTKNGIELVQIDSAVKGESSKSMKAGCSACADCPTCSFGGAKSFIAPDCSFIRFEQKLVLNDTAGSTNDLVKDPPWTRPGLRAPPVA